MNLYALNETAINGWAWLHAKGSAAMTLGATGSSKSARLGRGTAKPSLVASGAGTRRVMGRGQASMALSGAGVITRRLNALGSAQMVLNAAGDARITTGVTGRATMMMDARGRLGLRVAPDGLAQMEMAATGVGRVAKAHYGASRMLLELQARGRWLLGCTVRGKATALMHTHTYGDGYVVGYSRGTAQLELRAAAVTRPVVRHAGSGKAIMELLVTREVTSQHRNVFATGALSLELRASNRARRTVLWPISGTATPRPRVMRVVNEQRTMRVGKQSTVRVPAEA